MAEAILGAGLRIIGASLRGNAAASGVEGGAATLSPGVGKDAAATTYLDIDFIPETDHLRLSMRLDVDELPNSGAEKLIRDAVSVWTNGRPHSFRVPTPEQARHLAAGPAGALATVAPADGLQIGLKAVIGVVRGQANTLRIATAALGGAAILSSLAVQSEAAPGGNGQAVGNPATGNNGNGGTQGNAEGSNGGGGSGGGGGGGGAGSDNVTAVDDSYDIFPNGTITVDPVANDIGPGNTILFITQINGVDVEAGDTVTLATGESITLNADGTLTIVGDLDPSASFDYTVAIGTGNAQRTDTATVTLNTVPCFVAGTMIRTERGDMPVERLTVGQRVLTRDDGLQPIRWIGRRTLPAEGSMAPVRIARNTLGEHAALMVSPLHRLLIRRTQAQLLFGDSEVLVAARDLIDDRDICQVSGGQVHYVHLMFDRHQIVWSEGLQSESFLPGPQTTSCFEREIVDEIRTIFPDLDPWTGIGYGPAARPTLRAFEARLLVA